MRWKTPLTLLISVLVGLLLARLVLLLCAADPSLPFVQMIMLLTQPITAPLIWLDAHQPTTGVRFERSTLTLVCFLIVCGLILNLYSVQRNPRHE